METITGKDIAEAAGILRGTGIVAIPTETVYGLAGNALSEDAVLKIFKAKNRPFFDPLIVHAHSIKQIGSYVQEIPMRLLPLMERFMPGPLTVLLPRKAIIPDLVTSGMERVAVRIPADAMALGLLEMLDFPLAAPSANPFGYISPTAAQHVQAQLGGIIPYILDGGNCRVGIESTIIGMDGDSIVVYRLGGLAIEQITEIAGEVTVLNLSSSNPASPGMLQSHYAPRKPLVLGDVNQLLTQYAGQKIAILSFCKKYEADFNIILSTTGNMEEAAKNLFAAMRALDQTDADIIIAEPMPDHGLGRAINDRLARAAMPER